MSRLGDLEARCAEATEGPWAVGVHGPEEFWFGSGYEAIERGEPDEWGEARWLFVAPCSEDDSASVNAVFIASARTDLPDLAQAFRVVGEALRSAQKELGWTPLPEDETALTLVDEWLGESDD